MLNDEEGRLAVLKTAIAAVVLAAAIAALLAYSGIFARYGHPAHSPVRRPSFGEDDERPGRLPGA